MIPFCFISAVDTGGGGGTSSGIPYPSARSGQAGFVEAFGDSIAKGVPYTDADCYAKYMAAGLPGSPTYKSWGLPSQTAGTILNDYINNVTPKLASIALVEGGVNDIALGVDEATTIANKKALITALVNDGAMVIEIPILPWTNGTQAQNEQKDRINAAVSSWVASTYPNHFTCDLSALVGQDRPGFSAGNLWDIKPAYNSDGVHFNLAGYQAMGAYLANFILSNTV